MKNRSSKSRSYSSGLKVKTNIDSEPSYTRSGVSITYTCKDIKRWYEVFSSFYYEKADAKDLDIEWTDHTSANKDKDEIIVETILKIENQKKDFNVIITLFHTTGSVRVQGRSIKEWLDNDYKDLEILYKDSSNNNETIINNEVSNIFSAESTSLEEESILLETISENIVKEVMHNIQKESPTLNPIQSPINDPNENTNLYKKEDTPNINNQNTKNVVPKQKKDLKNKDEKQKMSITEDWMDNVMKTVNKFDDRMCKIQDSFESSLNALISLIQPLVEQYDVMKKTMDNNNNKIKELEGNSNNMKSESMDISSKMMK